MAQYVEHYEAQLGGGGMETFYRGAPYQRGHGIGSFLGGLFRKVLPLLTSGAKAVGREVLRTGVNVMSDMDSNVPFKESMRARAMESGRNLQQRAKDKVVDLMKGSGYKGAAGGRGRQLLLARVNRLVAAQESGRTGRVNKRKSKKKKTENNKKKKKKKSAKTGKLAAAKSGKGKKGSKKRPVTDIFGPR